jgi:two-component system, NtrC family, response regulator AtoC
MRPASLQTVDTAKASAMTSFRPCPPHAERGRPPESAMSYDTVDDPKPGPPESSSPPPLVLVVMSPTGTGSVPVPAQGTLVLGRAVECDVRIEDTKLSRRHAELRCGATIALVDLGSRNGSYVRSERVPPNVPVPLRVGDAIAIGSTLLTLQRAAAGERPRHVWSHGYFEARIEEECARAARGGSPFAILRLRLGAERADAPTRDTSADSATPLAALDGADMLASYAPQEYEALFTRTEASEADAHAAALAKKLAEAGASFVLSVAAYPRDGRTPEALIEHTSRGLRERMGGASGRATAGGAIERMEAILSRVAAGVINVLVLGETGVGKDVLARRIHELSPRAKMPLVSINCGALSESLLEGELFGHEKGAFTGAVQAKQGLLESANGGTIFLDEIGEMPLALQVKLLRVLEQREVMRVGAVRPRIIDVRFIAATNRNLESEIVDGRFRQDLYFRLNGITLSLPPLRERTEEIGALALTFIAQACEAMGRRDQPRIAPDAMETMLAYQWPGNIRELRNLIERAVLLCTGNTIMREHLPMEKMGAVVPRSGPPSTRAAAPPAPNRLQARSATIPAPGASPPPDQERQRVLDALEACAGNQSQAAKVLGISRATLIRRIEEHAIRRPRKRE